MPLTARAGPDRLKLMWDRQKAVQAVKEQGGFLASPQYGPAWLKLCPFHADLSHSLSHEAFNTFPPCKRDHDHMYAEFHLVMSWNPKDHHIH